MNSTSIDSLLKVVNSINNQEMKKKKAEIKMRDRIPNLLFLLGSVIPISIAIIFSLLLKLEVFDERVKIYIGFSIFITYLSLMLQPFAILYANRKSIKSLFINPFSILVDNVKSISHVDVAHIKYFKNKSKFELQILRAELQSEKIAMDKRMSLFIGKIEKVGILPGIIAMAVIFTKLKPEYSDFMYSVVIATPVLYIVGAVFHMVGIKTERIISLIDIIIENKK